MPKSKNDQLFRVATKTTDLIWNRLLKLAQKHNIVVYFGHISSKIKGFYFNDPSVEIKAILLDSNLKEKQNFVMAHELGHAMLHTGQGSVIFGYKGMNDKSKVKRIEYEADRFAGKLINILERGYKL